MLFDFLGLYPYYRHKILTCPKPCGGFQAGWLRLPGVLGFERLRLKSSMLRLGVEDVTCKYWDDMAIMEKKMETTI